MTCLAGALFMEKFFLRCFFLVVLTSGFIPRVLIGAQGPELPLYQQQQNPAPDCPPEGQSCWEGLGKWGRAGVYIAAATTVATAVGLGVGLGLPEPVVNMTNMTTPMALPPEMSITTSEPFFFGVNTTAPELVYETTSESGYNVTNGTETKCRCVAHSLSDFLKGVGGRYALADDYERYISGIARSPLSLLCKSSQRTCLLMNFSTAAEVDGLVYANGSSFVFPTVNRTKESMRQLHRKSFREDVATERDVLVGEVWSPIYDERRR